MTALNIGSADNYSDCMKLLLENNAKITNTDLWYAQQTNDIGTMYTLLTSPQVPLSPGITMSLKKLTENAGSLFEVINAHLCNNKLGSDNPLYDNVPNNDVTLLADDITS